MGTGGPGAGGRITQAPVNLVPVLNRRDSIENRKLCSELLNVSVMPGRGQQKNLELKCAAQSCSKLADLFQKLRPDDQFSTNESLDDVTSKNMQEESGGQKLNYVFLSLSAS